jgi:tetratricopeptide (TPR) repeat protein
VFLLLLLCDLIQKPALRRGEAAEALGADLVEHPVHVRGKGVRFDAPAAAGRRHRGRARRLVCAALHHHHPLDRTHRGNTTAAVSQLNSALESDPSLWRAWAALGRAYDREKRWSESAAAYEKSLAASPTPAVIANNMGMSNLALAEEQMLYNNPEAALKQVSYALSALKDGTPARQRAQDLKADAIEAKRKQDEAKSSF